MFLNDFFSHKYRRINLVFYQKQSVAVETSTICSIEPRIGWSDMGLVSHHEAIISPIFNSPRNGWTRRLLWNWREHSCLQVIHIFLLIQKLSCSHGHHWADSQHHVVSFFRGEGVGLDCCNKLVSRRSFKDSWAWSLLFFIKRF